MTVQLGIIIISIVVILILIYTLSQTNKRIQSTVYKLISFNEEIRNEIKDYENKYEVAGKPITDIENLVDEIIIERRKELQKIQDLEKYRKDYIGNVAHELKTPIFNIQGYIETLNDGAIHDESVNQSYIDKTLVNINRMITIIDDLDTITQLESGNLVLNYEVFDIVSLCKDVIDNSELTASLKNINLYFTKNYLKPIYVKADEYRIRQVVTNLISNAIKYGKDDGNVEITFIQFGDIVEVVIRDDGIGIAAEHLPRLFERFYRVDKGRSRAQGGSGLGLAIVKHITEAHNQTIEVWSKPNQGTKFTFTLEYVRKAPNQ